MKLKIKKQKRSLVVTFSAESSEDGVNLKTALMSALKDGTPNGGLPARVLEELGNMGYGEDAGADPG